uniref:Uncharacterized protein n=1 Tax=Arundo donax TaxID=35708 RepID=A0A0A9CTG4_ARUDO
MVKMLRASLQSKTKGEWVSSLRMIQMCSTQFMRPSLLMRSSGEMLILRA